MGIEKSLAFKQLTKNRGNSVAGKYNKYGEKITEGMAITYEGKAYDTQDQALDRRYSYASDEKAIFSPRRRQNLFGN